MARKIELTEDTAEFSRLLQSYIQSGSINFLIGSGASTPAIPTAGHLETEINALLAAGKDADANDRALKFIEDMYAKHAALTGGAMTADVSNTLKGYSEFVAGIDRILFERKNLLLPRQANIFTTNYDMLIEHVSSKIPSLVLNDGFDRAAGMESVFPFAPELYFDRTYRSGAVYSHLSEVPTINLLKMHGSLSWRKNDKSIVYDTAIVPKLSVADRADPAKVAAQVAKYFLILPNLRKFHSTTMDRVYYDLLRIFSNAMDRENAVLMSFGFSFEDEHILDITRRALRNPTSQLLIFSYTSECAAAFETKFSNHRNAAIICPPEDKPTGFDEFNNLLKSVLPRLKE